MATFPKIDGSTPITGNSYQPALSCSGGSFDVWTQPHLVPPLPSIIQHTFLALSPLHSSPCRAGGHVDAVAMAPIKLEPGEGIDLHAQGLLLISREFAVNRSAPEKAKRRQKLFFLVLSFRVTTYSIYLSIPALVPRPMTELPGSLRGFCVTPPPTPSSSSWLWAPSPPFPWGVAWLFIVHRNTYWTDRVY